VSVKNINLESILSFITVDIEGDYVYIAGVVTHTCDINNVSRGTEDGSGTADREALA